MSSSNCALLAMRVGAHGGLQMTEETRACLGRGGAARALHQEGAEEMPTKAAKTHGLVLCTARSGSLVVHALGSRVLV